MAVRTGLRLWTCSTPCWATLLDLPQPVVAVLSLEAAGGSRVARHGGSTGGVNVFESAARVLQQMV